MESLLLELNQYLVRDTDMARFVTMVFCLVDSSNNTMEMASAGHTEVLLKNEEGEVFEIVPEGPAIGLIPNDMGEFRYILNGYSKRILFPLLY